MKRYHVPVGIAAHRLEPIAFCVQEGLVPGFYFKTCTTTATGPRIRRETGDAGVDVVFDSVGGRLMRPGLRLLAPMGRYVLYGFASVAGERRVSKVKAIREVLSVPLIYPPSLVTKNISLMGFNLYFVTKKSTLMRKTMEQLMRWHERGVFRTILSRSRFPRVELQ